MAEPNYFDIQYYRKEVPQKFLQYPLTQDRDGFMTKRLLTRAKILEVGAGARPFLDEMQKRGYQGVFKTMDVNRRLQFDYYSVEEIQETFDAILMREVVEHVPRHLIFDYLKKMKTILNPGGILVISTPNPWSPGWVHADYTHVSPWAPGDLYAIIRCFGFEPVEIWRVIWPSRILWFKKLYWNFHSRFYDIDFAGSYILLATKP